MACPKESVPAFESRSSAVGSLGPSVGEKLTPWVRKAPASAERALDQLGELPDHPAPRHCKCEIRLLCGLLHRGVGVGVEADHRDSKAGQAVRGHGVEVGDDQVDAVKL